MSIAVRLPEHVAGGRRRFISSLKSVAGTGVRALYIPSGGEGATAVDGAVSTRVWTHGTSTAGRLSKLGQGVALSFNGTTDYLDTPDAVDMTFIEPQTFSFFAVFRMSSLVAQAILLSKYADAASGEYFIDTLSGAVRLLVRDASAVVVATRTIDVALAATTWYTVGISYDGTGGASAMNGVTIYVNGAAVASTVANNAAYVATEDLTSLPTIGAFTAHTAGFWAGSLAMEMVVAANLTAGQQFQLSQLSKRFFGI